MYKGDVRLYRKYWLTLNHAIAIVSYTIILILNQDNVKNKKIQESSKVKITTTEILTLFL